MKPFPYQQPEITTENLHLRALQSKDAERYFAINSHLDVMSAYGVRPHCHLQETQDLIQYLAEQYFLGQMVRWGLFFKEKNLLIGDIGFWRFIPSRCRAEIGAKLLPEFGRKNLMTEAMRAILRIGFEDFGLNSVEGHVHPENKASFALVKKIGFRVEGRLKEHSFDPRQRKFTDTILVSLIRSEWFQKGNKDEKICIDR